MNTSSPPPVTTAWLTPAEAADRLGVTSATVRRWVRAGSLRPSVTTPGGHYRFKEADLTEQIAALPVLAPSHPHATPGVGES